MGCCLNSGLDVYRFLPRWNTWNDPLAGLIGGRSSLSGIGKQTSLQAGLSGKELLPESYNREHQTGAGRASPLEVRFAEPTIAYQSSRVIRATE